MELLVELICRVHIDKEHPLETSIDTVFTLEEINEALAKVKQGKSKGKTIITVREQ